MANAEPIYIVYDGDCPFCTRFVRLLKLRETVGDVELIDARSVHPIVSEISARNLDLDEGMVLKMEGTYYHGDACLNRLALLSTNSGLFNRLNHWVFQSEKRSRVLYPWLRASRNAALKALGRTKIDNLA